MPVAIPVRNLSRSKVILSQGTKGESIEWGHAGSDDGSDVQEVPEELWMGNKLRRAVSNGTLAEDTPEAMEEAAARQQQARQTKASDRQGEVDEAMRKGTPVGEIVISAEDMEKHLDSTAKQRSDSDVLDQVKAGIPATPSHSAAMDAVNSPG